MYSSESTTSKMSSKTQHKQPEHPTTSNYAFVHTHIENQRIDFWIPKGRHGFATNRAPQSAHNHESMLANSRTTSMSIHAQENHAHPFHTARKNKTVQCQELWPSIHAKVITSAQERRMVVCELFRLVHQAERSCKHRSAQMYTQCHQ